LGAIRRDPTTAATIDNETRFVLDLLKAKRAEVRNLQRTEQRAPPGSRSETP
jgi:hypothetical protein